MTPTIPHDRAVHPEPRPTGRAPLLRFGAASPTPNPHPVALGDDPALTRLRDLTATIREALAAEGDAGEPDATRAGAELWARRAALDADCPLDDDEVGARFEAMAELLGEIHAAEVRAMDALAAVSATTG